MGLPRSATIGPSLLNTSNDIATSQTPGSAGPITLNGSIVVNGVAILDNIPPITNSQRIVIGTGAGEGSNGTVFTIIGTDWNGNTVSETITCTAATSYQSIYDYSTVTQISVNKATAGAITVGTNNVGSTRPIFLDTFAPGPVALQIDVTGTVNYTVQSSLDDPNVVGYANMNWFSSQDTNVVNASTNQQSNFGYAPLCVRLLLNSGSGSCTLRVQQLDM